MHDVCDECRQRSGWHVARTCRPSIDTVRVYRDTGNTYRDEAVAEGAPVGNVYIQKSGLPNGALAELLVNCKLEPWPPAVHARRGMC